MSYTQIFPVIPGIRYTLQTQQHTRPGLRQFNDIGIKVSWFVLLNFVDIVSYSHLGWKITFLLYVPIKVALLTISIMVLFSAIMSTKRA